VEEEEEEEELEAVMAAMETMGVEFNGIQYCGPGRISPRTPALRSFRHPAAVEHIESVYRNSMGGCRRRCSCMGAAPWPQPSARARAYLIVHASLQTKSTQVEEWRSETR
jgi:hypothetical protein